MTEKKKLPLFKAQGHPLPKRVLRPFFYYSGKNGKESLDEKQYVQIANADLRLLLTIIGLTSYLFSFSAFILWMMTEYDQSAMVYMRNFFITGTFFIIFAFLRKPNKFLIFDRGKGMVHHPKWTFSFETVSGKWEDWGARLSLSASSDGPALHRLSLVYLPGPYTWHLDESSAGIDALLGQWSFLVQYMDPEGVLPDIPEFKDYPNTAKGVGTHEEWLELKKKPGFIDPYYEWLAELNENPELDVVNAEIEERRRPKWSD